jgi:methionyl-tRNA formyltransferase
MKILFMGTPDFAIFPLKALVESGENVVAAITQPDKPAGRSYKLTPPPVKIWAAERKIPVYQPQTLKGDAFSALLEKIDPELIIVAAYGKILPQNVLDYPRYGCINVHGSLLPEYRGAAPIQRAIIDGKAVTGITIMMMEAGLDTGDILLKKEVPIYENDNFETIHDRLGECGAAALTEVLSSLKEGSLTRTPQDHSKATYAAKIEKADCLINFARPARDVHNLIRGLSPAPLAFTHINGGCILKIHEAEIVHDALTHGAGPGTVLSLDHGIVVACADGAVRLLRVLPECKGCMMASDFIRGRKISVGDILS